MEDYRQRRISLHQTAARDASPAEIVETAAALGCEHVCLFTQAPWADSPFPVVADADIAALRARMDGVGITLLSATSFPLMAETDIAAYEAGLVRAAALGGHLANVRVLDEDRSRRTANFAALGELARSYDIEMTVEFSGFGKKAALPEALDMIRESGFGKLCLDPLHIARTGTALIHLRAVAPDAVGYAQLCDGPLFATAEEFAREGAYNRLPPGDGEFPLLEILGMTPEGMPLALEVPQEALFLSGVSVLERARLAVDGARRLFDRASQSLSPN